MITVSHCMSLATTSLQAYYLRRLSKPGLMSPSEEPKLLDSTPTLAVAAAEPLEVTVRTISYQDTCPLRQEVLRPDLDVVYYDGDLDDTSIHFGAFVNNELVGVISMFQEDFSDVKAEQKPACHLPTPRGNTQWRIRGFAVAAKMRSKGLGTKLIAACLRHAQERGGRMLWCVARCTAELVYTRQGFSTTGDSFFIEGVGQVCHMFRTV
ncbi:uncharacterized protein LOC114828427 [Galendromus occidentalis]|uniref:Uncharacterized protein LOC114828427 n=1 Tax=Galendromus occidentalis TaxID=34638 RepID=A0AAJ7WIK1_9ACAR|nr:uncharacterized protein LOC114828427 [Galendromus occidentalis]